MMMMVFCNQPLILLKNFYLIELTILELLLHLATKHLFTLLQHLHLTIMVLLVFFKLLFKPLLLQLQTSQVDQPPVHIQLLLYQQIILPVQVVILQITFILKTKVLVLKFTHMMLMQFN